MPLAPPRHRELLEKLESQTYTEVANWLVEKYKFPDGNIHGIAQSVRRMDKKYKEKKAKRHKKGWEEDLNSFLDEFLIFSLKIQYQQLNPRNCIQLLLLVNWEELAPLQQNM